MLPIKSPLAKTLLLFIVLVGIIFFVTGYQKMTNISQNNFLNPTKTPTPIQKSEVHSSNGTMKLIMQKQTNKDASDNYSFFIADISGKNERLLFTKNLAPEGEMILPPNSFSPDNKYLYLEENGPASLGVLVFKTTGLPFSEGEQYLDMAELLTKSKTGYSISHVTGWASPILIEINTMKDFSTKGPSFWFVVDSRAFLQLASH